MKSNAPRLPLTLLTSGGLDSSILLAHLLDGGARVQPLYVQFGLTWQKAELAALRRYLAALACAKLEPLVVLQMPVGDLYGEHWSITGRGVPGADTPDAAVFLPGRNLLLIVKAALWCQLNGLEELALAPLGSNPFADATPSFFSLFEAILNEAGTSQIRLTRPFADFTKRQVMQLGRDYPLELTFSCIDPRDDLHCGVCNKCAERQAAFRLSEADDPTRYRHPQNSIKTTKMRTTNEP